MLRQGNIVNEFDEKVGEVKATVFGDFDVVLYNNKVGSMTYSKLVSYLDNLELYLV